MLVYACTSNAGKLRELLAAVKRSGVSQFHLKPLPDLKSIVPPDETGQTFEENAVLKARYYATRTNEPVLCDDSGIEVDSLSGKPGVYSARYAGPNATDQDNNELLLRSLGNSSARSARFVCSIALAHAEAILGTAHGVVEGEILSAPRGQNGFGYDPLFWYEPLAKSFAELSGDEKLAVSHRGRAMEALLKTFRDS